MKRTMFRTMAMLFLVFVSFVLMPVVWAADQGESDKPFEAMIDEDGVQRADIKAGSYYFKPSHIIVKVNVPVELTLTKEEGITPHDFTIDAPDGGMEVRKSLGSEPVVVMFTPMKTGTYTFYCSKRFLFFASHRERGMEGTLEVRP